MHLQRVSLHLNFVDSPKPKSYDLNVVLHAVETYKVHQTVEENEMRQFNESNCKNRAVYIVYKLAV